MTTPRTRLWGRAQRPTRPALQRWLRIGVLATAAAAAAACVQGRNPATRGDARSVASNDITVDSYRLADLDAASWLPRDAGTSDGDGDAAAPGDGNGGRDGLLDFAGSDADADAAPQAIEAGTDAIVADTTADQPVVVGAWYQANRQICPTFCAALGKTNVAGPEGAHCMSGERRAASGMAQGIVFTYGCWPNCLTPSGNFTATSAGIYCYSPGQKRDNDPSDQTVACFCR